MRWWLHHVPFDAERQAEKQWTANLTRPGIEPNWNLSVADARSASLYKLIPVVKGFEKVNVGIKFVYLYVLR